MFFLHSVFVEILAKLYVVPLPSFGNRDHSSLRSGYSAPYYCMVIILEKVSVPSKIINRLSEQSAGEDNSSNSSTILDPDGEPIAQSQWMALLTATFGISIR